MDMLPLPRATEAGEFVDITVREAGDGLVAQVEGGRWDGLLVPLRAPKGSWLQPGPLPWGRAYVYLGDDGLIHLSMTCY